MNGGTVTLAYWVGAVILYLFAISAMDQRAAIILSAVLVMGALIYNQRKHAHSKDGAKSVFDAFN